MKRFSANRKIHRRYKHRGGAESESETASGSRPSDCFERKYGKLHFNEDEYFIGELSEFEYHQFSGDQIAALNERNKDYGLVVLSATMISNGEEIEGLFFMKKNLRVEENGYTKLTKIEVACLNALLIPYQSGVNGWGQLFVIEPDKVNGLKETDDGYHKAINYIYTNVVPCRYVYEDMLREYHYADVTDRYNNNILDISALNDFVTCVKYDSQAFEPTTPERRRPPHEIDQSMEATQAANMLEMAGSIGDEDGLGTPSPPRGQRTYE